MTIALGTPSSRADAAPVGSAPTAATSAASGASAAPAAPAASAAAAPAAAASGVSSAADLPPALPPGIVWETNNDDPPIGSPQALRGGTLNFGVDAYPLTFRLVGPNANDAFAAWNRLFTMGFGLVQRHPVTDRFIPMMATHWAVQSDQRTLYLKLDRDAKFSDGHPVTARDYVYTWTLMRSPHIVDPFYNNYAQQYYQSVDRIDDYTLRIVGTRPSWRPLADYAGLWPTPAHATTLDAEWVKRTTNQFQIAPGPYVVSETVRGESVTFRRVPNWWGDGKRYFQGQYNFDRIHLRVIPRERFLDYLRRGELDLILENTARKWNEEYDFPAVTNGWVHRARVMTDWPSGVTGLHMNLAAPFFRDRRVRQAMQHLFNFGRLNRNLMFGEYFRQLSFFEGSEYADPTLKSYAFDPGRARELLAQAGWHRPAELRARTVPGRLWNALRGLLFTRSDTADVLVNDRGEKASFTLTYGSKGLERHLTVVQQEYRRAGVDMRLQLLEPGTAFERGLERKFEMTLTNRTSGFYPSPRQYLHSDNLKTSNNNDIWGYGSPEVDALIQVYEDDLDFEARRSAMQRIDRIVHDEAFYIPFWSAPYLRVAYWDYLRFPEFYLPRRTEQLTDYLVYWIDPERKARLAEAMKAGTRYPLDRQIDKDYYKIRQPQLAASAP
ncbi:MAG: extracellular solute-binding protein [Rubrivivax sp.]